MESLRSTESQEPKYIVITEWTSEQLDEAYLYHEERLPKSEVHADALMQIEAEVQRRKDLKKG